MSMSTGDSGLGKGGIRKSTTDSTPQSTIMNEDRCLQTQNMTCDYLTSNGGQPGANDV